MSAELLSSLSTEQRASLEAVDPRTTRRVVFSVVSSDPLACNLCDTTRETSKVCRVRLRQAQTQIDSARGRRAPSPYCTAQLCDECRALITTGAHQHYDEATLYADIRPIGVTEAEAAPRITQPCPPDCRDRRHCVGCDQCDETTTDVRVYRRGGGLFAPPVTLRYCTECVAIIEAGHHQMYGRVDTRPPFLVRFLDADAKLSTVIKAGRALSPSGQVALRWVVDDRNVIVGVELCEARR